MTDSVSNNYNNQYQYKNSELQKYDTDSDGNLSIFEIENIQDDNDIELLAEDLGYMQVAIEEPSTEEQIQSLESKLSSVKDEQGAISSAWNAIKCFTGLGSSTDKCEQAISDFKNGKITYEEADSIISEFSTKQQNSVNLAANIATGIVAVAAVGTAVATGGLSLVAGAAIGAGVGAATKAGLKFADRATNKVEGDALDAKQITKDALSGAVDGAVSVATLGIGSGAVTAKNVATQTLKQTVIQGAKIGAIDGAVSGAVTGAADYTIEAALEEDVEFNTADLIKTTLVNTAGGAITGGIMGSASAGIQYTKLKPSVEALSSQASKLNKEYSLHIDEAKAQVESVFNGDNSVQTISGRAKSEDSILSKLISKFDKGKLASTADDACFNAIGDGYGTRLQLKNLSTEETKNIIEDCLYGYDISYEQFIKYMDGGDTSTLSDAGIATIKEIKSTVIDLLKEQQTQEAVDSLCENIISGKFTITELNNYGNDISSYFTQTQLEQISAAYQQANPGQKLDIVTQLDTYNVGKTASVDVDDSGVTTVITDKSTITNKGATKDSGYTSSQMNTKHNFEDGSVGLGELQIRGTEVNQFADVEHIPYDIRQGKITASDTKYKEIYDVIKDMSDDTYTAYNSYLKDVYNYLRLKELGIETTEPMLESVLKGSGLSEEAINLLSREGLTKIATKSS